MMPFGCVTFDYYINVFFGSAIAQKDFSALQTKAAAYVDSMCKGMCRKVQEQDWDQLKFAVCSVAEILQMEERLERRAFAAEKPVASETVGNYSVSYGSTAVSNAGGSYLERKKREALTLYLSAIPALENLFSVRSFSCLHHIR